jgi:Ca2+-binding EF-hand superfamily protein
LTAKGVSSAEATKMFDAIDTNKTGSIGKSDIETAVKNGKLKPPPDAHCGSRKAGGPGGAGKPGGASKTSTNYAAADTNQDGVVSVQEAATYAIKHPSVSTPDSTKTDPSNLGKNVDKLV